MPKTQSRLTKFKQIIHFIEKKDKVKIGTADPQFVL